MPSSHEELAARSCKPEALPALYFPYMSGVPQSNPQKSPQKTFYLETFGCQMNVHDSEKVVGTLVQQGYRQVQSEEQADLILYNTCSIRDKAEQKVFHRLADFKKLQAQGKQFGVLGGVAQQEGDKIFERAPHVSLVCGSASYRKLPEMLAQIEGTQDLTHESVERESFPPAGESAVVRDDTAFGKRSGLEARGSQLIRITGLDDRQTDECFE